MIKSEFLTFIYSLQDKITEALEGLEPSKKFQEDLWDRPGGGGGKTRILSDGQVIEKGGVNTSAVHGKLSPAMTKQLGVEEDDFFACGISLVLHPVNPHAPTVHANFRYFELYDEDKNIVNQWLGGGIDLTPYIIYESDIKHFHRVCKTTCDLHHKDYYPKFKEACDQYFWNHHREEARGVGGIFFDYLKPTESMSLQDQFDFVKQMGNQFLTAYLPILTHRKDQTYTPEQREWQLIRRGRYVEFNLIHDKGTLFGLKTKGRIESIFMSLPPLVKWAYQAIPNNKEQQQLVDILIQPRAWV